MAKKTKRKRDRTAEENAQIAQEEASDTAAGQRMVSSLPLARTGEEQSVLDMRKNQLATAGQMTAEQSDTLGALKSATGSVYDPMHDARVQGLLDKHMAGLEGANAEENQALRAQMIRSEQAGTASAMRGLKALGGQAGVTGRAAMGAAGNVYRNAMIARAMGESDLTAKNIALKQSALANYTGALTGFTGQSVAAGEETGRRLGTMANYSLGTSTLLSNEKANAQNMYSTDVLNQAANERESWIQSYLGGQGLNIARRGALRGEKLGKAGLAMAQNAYS